MRYGDVMAHAYLIAVFPDEPAATTARNLAEALPGARVARSFVVLRQGADFQIAGATVPERADAQAPLAAFGAIFRRLFSGTSSDDDVQAIDDAELLLADGQAAVVALVEGNVDAVEATLARAGGATRRASPATLDDEDTRRFLNASSL